MKLFSVAMLHSKRVVISVGSIILLNCVVSLSAAQSTSDPWQVIQANEFFVFDDGMVQVTGGGDGPAIATYPGWETDAYTGFSLAATVAVDGYTAPAFAGLVFNFQDADNFYIFRINGVGTVQIVRVRSGRPQAIVNASEAIQYTRGLPLRLALTSPTPFVFDAKVRDVSTGETLWEVNGASDRDQSVSRGGVGISTSPRVSATFENIVFVNSADHQDAEWAPQSVERSWVSILAGTFRMGAQPGPAVMGFGIPSRSYNGSHWDEAPVHTVEIGSAFEMSSHLVTFAKFEEFKPEHRAFVEGRGLSWQPQAPVTMVTWHDAVAYTEWLSAKTGELHRLPTEAEWEYAAQQLDSLPLGQMDGTVREWCLDWWAPYPNRSLFDPIGPIKGQVKIVRGSIPVRTGEGSMVEAEMPETGGRVAVADTRRWRRSDRSGTLPGDRRDNIGFRLVKAPMPTGCSWYDRNDQAAVFADVSTVEKQWQPVPSDSAIFAGGKGFILPPLNPEELPYWGRQHVPSIVYCDNGDILLSCITSPTDNSDQMAVLITRLRNGQSEWDPPARLFIAPDFNTIHQLLWRDDTGVIHSHIAYGANELHDYSTAKMSSFDNGVTWTDPKIVFKYPVKRASLADYSGQPNFWPQMKYISLQDGTLIAAIDAGWPSAHGRNFGTALFASTDNGNSWEERSRWGWNWEEYAKPGGTAGWIAGYHASVVELQNGDLLAPLGRTDNINGRAPASRSSDGGKTWTYEASQFPPLMWHQRPALLRLAEGPILLVSYTDSSDDLRAGKREGIEIKDAVGKTHRGYGMFSALSFDEGKTWTHFKIIPNNPDDPWGSSDQTGYVDLIQTPDNMIHLANGRRYFNFNLAWLMEPMPAH